MIKVSVQNHVTGMSYGSTFETQAEADAWIALCTAKNTWGQPGEYTVSFDPEGARKLAMDKLKQERNLRLTACDYTQLPDYPMAPPLRKKWANYRQALRDLPAVVDPFNPRWPKEPK